jgi:uncharacterized protein with von Willebrand factor type A (vWA) domain
MADSFDLADIVARFVGAVRAAGVPVGPDRAALFARAVTAARPSRLAELRFCAHATLAVAHGQIAVVDRVFDAVFGGFTDPADARGGGGAEPDALSGLDGRSAERVPDKQASAWEALRQKDFSDLSPAELDVLAGAMARLRLLTPQRKSRRMFDTPLGHRVNARRTLRFAQGTGGEPFRLVRKKRRLRPRRLVMLCDISGSMEPYARAMLQLLYCARGSISAEAFTFATRLTRVTAALDETSPARALAAAGKLSPDWSGGTRIGLALKDFLDRFGRAGMARGAIVVVISDGWESGDPLLLGQQMARLARVAYRIVWVNPRTQSELYRPLVGGMAAAWPYCDAVVSAHSLAALDDFVRVLVTF